MCVCVCVCLRLLLLQAAVVGPDSELPDELLYGRVGYLYALLYVNKELGAGTVDEGSISEVTSAHTAGEMGALLVATGILLSPR